MTPEYSAAEAREVGCQMCRVGLFINSAKWSKGREPHERCQFGIYLLVSFLLFISETMENVQAAE